MTADRRRLAAQYLRVSSEKQSHALEAQQDEIARFAAAHGMDIIRTYEDAGRSGLTLGHRPALQTLMADIASGRAVFTVLLIQDVSRWGRFQDIDEAGHYEFLCRMAGVQVCYCSETFDNDPSPNAGILKAVKRLMAAEFSRDLSDKVRRAQFHWAEQGYSMGGKPGFGFRRVILDENGDPLHRLGPGDRKFIAAQRTSIVWGPPEEVDTIRRIYRLYTEDDLSMREIAVRLNASQAPAGEAGKWDAVSVGRILSNPKYSGRYDFGKRVRILGGPTVNRRSDEWLALRLTSGGMVSEDLYQAARIKRRKRVQATSDHEILQRLAGIIQDHRRLSLAAIRSSPSLPTPQTLFRKFGSLMRMEAMLGLYPDLPELSGDGPRLQEDLERSCSGVWGPFRVFSGETQLAIGEDREAIAQFRRAVGQGRPQVCIFDEASGRILIPRPRMEVFFPAGRRPPRQGQPAMPLIRAYRVACAFLHRRERVRAAHAALATNLGEGLSHLEPDWSRDVSAFIDDLLFKAEDCRESRGLSPGSGPLT